MLKPIHLLRHHGTNKQEKYPRTMPAIVHSTTYNKHNTRHDQHQRGLVSAGHMVRGVVSRLSALDIAPLPVILLRGCSGCCQYQDIADTELADMRIAMDTVIIKGLSVNYVIGFCRKLSTQLILYLLTACCCRIIIKHIR